jgi:23S rRNA (uridine2552-2'-O)-methyltransferase
MPTKKTSSGGKKRSGDLPASRGLSVSVHTAKKRTHSSTLWLHRQLNDPYVAAAKAKGYRSRAAFKIIQLDEKYKIFKVGQRVVDLGAAPGGWTQYAVEKTRAREGRGRVVGIDLLEIEPIEGATLMQGDFTHDDAPEKLKEALNGKADLVLSDMAANTMGDKATDHLRIMILAELAADFAVSIMAPGGAFVCKLFQGGAEKSLLDTLKQNFSSVKHAKPAASRQDSAETYIVATGFKGR